MPDDHSDVVPLLPIPNRTVKRVSADDSADTRVKVGHCQAITASESPTQTSWAFCFFGSYTLCICVLSTTTAFLRTSSCRSLLSHELMGSLVKNMW
jgi:hypothetical protein